MSRNVRFGIAIAITVAMILIAISGRVYDATSPSYLPMHELWRKAYSIIAFAVLGVAWRFATRARIFTVALWIGAVSLIIEIGQNLNGSREGLISNAIDIVCGIAGGWIGAALLRFVP